MSKFTFPVVISKKNVAGFCLSNIGAFVFVNSDGWIVTAAHMVTDIGDSISSMAQVRAFKASVDAIIHDASASPADRASNLATLGNIDLNKIEYCSVWWAGLADQLEQISIIDEVDLAVGRLKNFDPAAVSSYPTLKLANGTVAAGMPLCKYGYPFYGITPHFDPVTETFFFPAGALPIPSFPMDGMITRVIDIPATSPAITFPLQLIETSSPGLRGQSGGPTVDEHGQIWAIQTHTQFLQLGFEAKVAGGAGHVEHQFLNVGRGVHVATIAGLLDSLGVKYDVSTT